MADIQNIDSAIVLYIAENMRCGFLNILMIFFSMLGDYGAVWLITSVVLLFMKEHRQQGFRLLFSLALCTLIGTLVLKNIIARPRPEIAEFTILLRTPGGFSMPSGHTASSFAAAYVLTKGFGKKGALTYILASLIAVSRVYAGVHYPSDIIVGIIIGTLCAWTVTRKS